MHICRPQYLFANTLMTFRNLFIYSSLILVLAGCSKKTTEDTIITPPVAPAVYSITEGLKIRQKLLMLLVISQHQQEAGHSTMPDWLNGSGFKKRDKKYQAKNRKCYHEL